MGFPFDDRGIVYLRHGAPSKRVTPFVYGSTANESWRYDRADGQWFFHFCTQGDLRDYRLIESAVDISFSRCNTGGVQMDQLLMSRYDLSPMYTRIATWGRNASARLARDERNLGRASIAEGTTSDTHELRYARVLPVVVRPLVAGRRGDSSLVHIAFSVADLLPPEEIPAPFVTMVPLRLRFAAFDSTGAAVGRLDTTVVRRVDPARPAASERFALALPPGDWVYRMAVETVDSAGTLLERDTLRVHDFTGHLELSDLLIGRRGTAQWISSPIDTAYVDPAQQFTPRQPLELYYEVYGLAPGSTFRTRLEVRKKKTGLLSKVFGGTPAAISFTFEEQQRGALVRARRTIDLDPLEPGVYIVAIEIVDGSDRTVNRQTELTVIEEDGP